MTKLQHEKPPWEVCATVRDSGDVRAIVVQVTPDEVKVRQKGRRRGYSLPWEAVYFLAVESYVRRRERVARRMKKDLGRRPRAGEIDREMKGD